MVIFAYQSYVERVKKRSAARVTGCHLEWLGMDVPRESRMQWPLMRPLSFLVLVSCFT